MVQGCISGLTGRTPFELLRLDRTEQVQCNRCRTHVYCTSTCTSTSSSASRVLVDYRNRVQQGPQHASCRSFSCILTQTQHLCPALLADSRSARPLALRLLVSFMGGVLGSAYSSAKFVEGVCLVSALPCALPSALLCRSRRCILHLKR